MIFTLQNLIAPMRVELLRTGEYFEDCVHVGTLLITLRKIRDFAKPKEPDLLARTD